MNHYAWTYVAGGGRNTKVGLYHSSTTGHLMIYAGKKIVTIDFKVLDSKEYTFFIDEELCKIKLERRGDEMYYFFEIDKKTDTPLNRARWARERKHLRQMLLSFGIIGLLVAAVVVWSKSGGRDDDARNLLREKGVETFGRLTSLPENENGTLQFNFIANGKTQKGEFDLNAPGRSLSANKFPLKEGDEFVVRYVPERPSLSRIYLLRPTERQVSIYRKKALMAYSATHPETSAERAECLLEIAHEMEGVDGYALFYFHQTPPGENLKHNSETFRKLFESYLFQGKIKKHCPSE